MEALKRFLENPVIDILIAITLIISSFAEGWDDLSEGLTEFSLGVHHGVLLFGVAMLLRGVVEFLEALIKAHEKKQQRMR